MDEHELMFHYKTYFTTLTYYNTILQDGFPVVRTSKETISNLVSAPIYVSGKFVEKTKVMLNLALINQMSGLSILIYLDISILISLENNLESVLVIKIYFWSG